MKTRRDMTDHEFRQALKRRGMELDGICARWIGTHVRLAPPCANVHVPLVNAGTINLRALLAWLIKQQEKHDAQYDQQPTKAEAV